MNKLFEKDTFPDRPWVGRGYGRMRLDEALAKDLDGILYDEIQRRLEDVAYAQKHNGNVANAKHALKRVNALKERTRNMIREQGWANEETA